MSIKVDKVISYLPRTKLAIVNMFDEDMVKLELADFIGPSISPFFSPMVCFKKTIRALQVYIDLWIVNKKTINNAYLLHQYRLIINHGQCQLSNTKF